MNVSARPSLAYALVVSVIVVASVLLLGFVLVTFHIIPTGYENYVYGALWLLASVVITNLISSFIRRRLLPQLGPANASSVSFVARLTGYVIAFIGFLAIIRVTVSEALAAGGFAGIVVGLASQFVLSNIFGGIVLILTRPFKVGDRITFTTWQYGLMVPTYPPKFFSQDYLVPGYTGTVTEVNLMYTIIVDDNNVPIKVPNSIMAQAAIFVHSSSETRRVRTRYEVPKDLDPELVIAKVKDEVRKLPIVADDPTVRVIETSRDTYVIAIDANCKTIYEEEARNDILLAVMRTIKSIQQSTKSSQAASRTS